MFWFILISHISQPEQHQSMPKLRVRTLINAKTSCSIQNKRPFQSTRIYKGQCHFPQGKLGGMFRCHPCLKPTQDNRAAGCHRTRASEIACWPKRASSMGRKFCRSAGGQRMVWILTQLIVSWTTRRGIYIICIYTDTLVLDRMTKHGSQPSQRDAHTEQDPLVCRLSVIFCAAVKLERDNW